MREVFLYYLSKIKGQRDSYRVAFEDIENYLKSGEGVNLWEVRVKMKKWREHLNT